MLRHIETNSNLDNEEISIHFEGKQDNLNIVAKDEEVILGTLMFILSEVQECFDLTNNYIYSFLENTIGKKDIPMGKEENKNG